MTKQISSGVVHNIPTDMKQELQSNKRLIEAWNSLTPLARNEFICWVQDAKKQETQKKRITRTCEDLLNGKRRPCCWAGCKHR